VRIAGGSGGLGTTDLNNRPGVSSQECLDLINAFRAQQGRSALSYRRDKEPCANTQVCLGPELEAVDING
jgi:hypothetical protein